LTQIDVGEMHFYNCQRIVKTAAEAGSVPKWAIVNNFFNPVIFSKVVMIKNQQVGQFDQARHLVTAGDILTRRRCDILTLYVFFMFVTIVTIV
jgi:hypothetical protein